MPLDYRRRDGRAASRTSLLKRTVATSRQTQRLSGSGGANFTRSRSQLRGIYIRVTYTRAFRRSRFGSRERNGLVRPSSAPSPKRAEDDRAAVEGTLRDLHAQVFRRRPRTIVQLPACAAGSSTRSWVRERLSSLPSVRDVGATGSNSILSTWTPSSVAGSDRQSSKQST